jgi:hypothetical protein
VGSVEEVGTVGWGEKERKDKREKKRRKNWGRERNVEQERAKQIEI